MKVYVLGEECHEGIVVDEIYSTRELAIYALQFYKSYNESDIYEFELNPVEKNEKYVSVYVCNINYELKQPIWEYQLKEFPSMIKCWEFTFYSSPQTTGYGKTSEEAKSNAEIGQKHIHRIWQVWDVDNKGNDNRTHLVHPSMAIKNGFSKFYAMHEDFNVAKIAVMEYRATGKLSPFLTVV